MTLSAGTFLGPYQIVAPLGAGGMGEVYSARDTRLGRDVAVKVLPAALAKDADRLRRFELEARASGMLSHPNILVLHDIGAHEGSPYLVSELLAGIALGERLKEGPLPARKAVDYALQIARGLAAAHSKGIVHRDLKPDNLFLTSDGGLKILDFGLAKLKPSKSTSQDTQGPTEIPQTDAGVVMGTVGYMSPEQVRGREADHRSDIFSFGAILYEMLSGLRAFRGDSVVETMNAILKEDPAEVSATRPDVVPALDRMVRRCLEKNPEERFQSARDVGFALEAVSTTSGSARNQDAVEPKQPVRSRWPKIVGMAAAAVVLSLLSMGLSLWWRSQALSAPAWEGELLGGSTVAFGPRVSPDGRMLAFSAMVNGQTQVAVMKPETGNWTILTKERNRGSSEEVAWSADGSKIYFSRVLDVPRGIFSVPVLGGDERLILEDAQKPLILPDGSLLVTRINAQRKLQLYHFWPQTGTLQPLGALVSVMADIDDTAPVCLFPDAKEVVYFGKPVESAVDALDHVYALDLRSGRTHRLAPALAIPRISSLAVEPDGRSVLLGLESGNLSRIVEVPRDGGASVRILASLTREPEGLDVGPDGSLYLSQTERPAEIVFFSVSGAVTQRIALSDSFGISSLMNLPLPDGRVLLTARMAGHDRVVVISPEHDPTPLTDTEEETSAPMCLLGGGEVAFMGGAAASRSIVIASLSDGRIVRRLQGAGNKVIDALAGSIDGKTLYFVSSGMIWALPANDGAPRKVRAGDGIAIDPNGRDLIVQLKEKDGVRLLRMPLSGGAEEPIPIRGNLPLAGTVLLAPNAVGLDGRIAVRVAPRDSWFWPAALLDPKSGKLEPFFSGYDADMAFPGRTPDGRIITVALPLRANLWRFRPVAK